jgi:hypothetical protein
MNNYKLKLVDSSRLVADILVQEIGDDEVKFSEMLEIALLDKYPISMRAARVVALCDEVNPSLIHNSYKKIMISLPYLKVDGVIRSFLKILADSTQNFDEESAGLITDLAFKWLGDSNQAISIRYYCIEILLKIAVKYPEIGDELNILLENLPDDISAGLKSKSSKILASRRKK